MINQVSIKSIQNRLAKDVPVGREDDQIVRRLWWAALEILQNEILLPMNLEKGLWLASPLPALYESKLLDRLQGWVWSPDEFSLLNTSNFGLLPPTSISSINNRNISDSKKFSRLPLRKEDGYDPLLLIITQDIQIALALQGKPGAKNLLMRNDPETLADVLKILDKRLDLENPQKAQIIRDSLADLGQLRCNEEISKIFWPRIASKLAGIASSLNIQTSYSYIDIDKKEYLEDSHTSKEISLLEALTHEIRTPLATIRTFIRSLLKRKDLPETVLSRLKEIDTECTEQIDRFGLFFNAAELERNEVKESQLARIDLGQLLQFLSPAWEKQLKRRGIQLSLDITPGLPEVLSDPCRLELMLSGLIDRNTRGIQTDGILLLELRPAGQRLKLKISSNCLNIQDSKMARNEVNTMKSDFGTVLSWDPNTGSLQLTQAATQRLLASLGGRLTRTRDSGITIFFPTADAS